MRAGGCEIYIPFATKEALMKYRFFAATICIELLIIICIAIASFLPEIGFALFYNVLYGLVLSTLVPILYLHKKNISFHEIGIKKMKTKQYIVLTGFVFFSIGGQIIPLLINGVSIRFDLLPICILPLIMTTFFEEFLFQGIIQGGIEKQYGRVAGVLLSGLLFSLYHLGYPGFRNISDLLLLFAVGIGFALAYKLSDNNLIVAYLVNLPNAFLTYILKSVQFPVFTALSGVFAGITIAMLVTLFIFTIKKRVVCIK